MKRLILTLGAGAMLLTGCISTNYYVLSTASEPEIKYNYRPIVIGVEKVTVPKYLFKREIAVAKSASQVVFLDSGTWAEDLDEGLTRRLIAFFQKKLNQPNVHEYPWELTKQPTYRVKVEISKFIAYDDKVYLDAVWQVENIKTGYVKSRLFSTFVPTSNDDKTIVASMDRAFAKLEETIANAIH